MAGKLMEVGKLCKNFGGLATLSDVDLCLEEGEIRGLICPNGAGESTLFHGMRVWENVSLGFHLQVLRGYSHGVEARPFSEERRRPDMIRKIEHIGVAVRDIREAEKMYTETLSLQVSSRETHGELRVAFFPVGDTTIELLQSTTPDGVIGKYIQEKGEGVHHIAFRVDDIRKALEDLRSKGVEMIDREPRAGARNAKIAFIDPRSTNGLLIELVEPGEE